MSEEIHESTEVIPPETENPSVDIDMKGVAPATSGMAVEGTPAEGIEAEEHMIPDTEMEKEQQDPAPAPRVTFLSYLSSPIVTLIVGAGEAMTQLAAHQALLCQSPFFAEIVSQFVEGEPRRVVLPDEDIEAVGSFLEFLYTSEYFPKKLTGQRTLETDPTLLSVDDSGEQLLCHARVYTLAEKWGVDALRMLASSKIHCINSTVQGEITYARYVYQHTKSDDTTIRAPIANFWAMRSHMLRSEAEDEFRLLCLEFPQFGYDVLTRVLDEKLKRDSKEKMHPQTSSGRKRARNSNAA